MTTLHKTMNAGLDKAAPEYKMIECDSALVVISGGTDLMALLDLLSLHIDADCPTGGYAKRQFIKEGSMNWKRMFLV